MKLFVNAINFNMLLTYYYRLYIGQKRMNDEFVKLLSKGKE